MTVNRLPLAFLGALSLVLSACGGDSLTLPNEGEAAHIEVLDGSAQQGRVNELLTKPLLVRVTDSRNRPVPNVTVVFTFTDGPSAGIADPASDDTDADGQASAALKLGTREGQVTGKAQVEVASGAAPIEASFTATSLAADANGIALVSGDNQSGTVGTALALPLVVKVTDQFGNPIPNVAIEWSVGGGGTVSATSTVTGADGTSSVTRTLGSTAGPQTTSATAGLLAGSPVIFNHTARAGSATGVVKVSGDNQSASPGTELAFPLVVQVLDGGGNPIPNRAVSWLVGTGGGSVSDDNTDTDAEGKATVRWTLGPNVGPNTVNAVVSGVGSATFNATATAGSPSADNSQVSASPGTISAGSGSSTITVTVRDASNNPVAGAGVSVASTGTGNSITPPSGTTGANGVATFTFSSTVAETKTISATAGGVAISDQATIVVQKLTSNTRIETDDPDPSLVSQAVHVVFTVTGSGPTPTGQVTVTAEGGSESCTASVADGACDITLTAPGDNRRLIATYGGDASYQGSFDRENHRVNPSGPAGTTTTITSDSPDPSAPGIAVTVSFSVTSVAGTPDGTVVVTDPQGGTCSATVAAGSCQYVPGGAGPRTITAAYEGNAGFAPSSGTAEHTVNSPPTAAFSAPTDCLAGQPCSFTDTSTDSDGTIASRAWGFQDGNPGSSGDPLVSVVFPSAGPRTVTLTVTDNLGANSTISQTVVVGP